jgi:hypothetical protein
MTDKFCWLIEAPGQRYLAVRNAPATYYEFHWTQDHYAALAFQDQKQADLTMMAVRQLSKDAPPDTQFGRLFAFEVALGNARPVEHGWMDHPQREQQSATTST